MAKSSAMIDLRCDHCARPFQRYRGDLRPGQRIYCSTECKHAATRVNLTCERCGKAFTMTQSRLRDGNRGKYCSRSCKGSSQTVSCLTCGTNFKRASNGINEGGNYCSRECHYKSHQRIPYLAGDGSVAIPLTKGFVAFVDESDLEAVTPYSWHLQRGRKTDYAKTTIDGKERLLHRHIMNADSGEEVDHKDHNGLNNRRSNLRICTHAENLVNAGPQRNNLIGLRGVSVTRHGRFSARFRSTYLGTFATAEEAARARDAAAVEQYGEFAYQNFPERKAA